MAEVTKKKLASIYSLIVGFFLSVFSGHAHAGAFFMPAPQKTTATGKAPPTIYRTTTDVVPQLGMTQAPAPDAATSASSIVPAVGMTQAPAPTTTTATTDIVTTVGMTQSPAPDANTALDTDLIYVESIEDPSFRSYVSKTLADRGIETGQLTKGSLDTLRFDFLQMKIDALEAQILKLNEQTLSH